tara:strand:+ start:10378 stop:10917 length:540 start_codon:yes stop_codon:yes gene_type:complete
MKIIRDALSEEIISFCVDVYKKLDYSKLSPTFMWWPENLKHGQIAGPFVTPVPPNVVDRLLPEIQEHIWTWEGEFEFTFQYYIWGPNSGIADHDDAGHDVGATLYLNNFPLNYGGLFVYGDENDDLNVVAPTRNTLVVNDQKERHWVTTVSSQANFPRCTIQIWGKRARLSETKQVNVT